MTKKSFGSRVALFISNIEFNGVGGLKRRRGAEIDEVNMEKLLRGLGYEVVKYKDLTGQVIYKKNINKKKTFLSRLVTRYDLRHSMF